MTIIQPAAPTFQSSEYPEGYAESMIRSKGGLFVPDLNLYSDIENFTYSQIEKLVENWAYKLEVREGVLWCDIADAFLVSVGIPLSLEAREEYLKKNNW